MSLTLITGPANAAKVGAVLARLRAALSRDPVLVVPTSADVGHYSRELAGAGIVFGAQVTTFPRLMRDLARATGVTTKTLGPLSRDRVVRAVLAEVAAPSAGAVRRRARLPGGARRAVRASSSSRSRARAASAPPSRPGAPPAPLPPTPASSARSTPPTTAGWTTLGATDADGLVRLALDAFRADPAAWEARPLFLYGFDELTTPQLDVVETLVRRTSAEVCVALPYEPGRAALAGSAATVELLKPLAAEHLVLEPRSEHYAATARGALHHLERGLFEPAPARVPPNGAVRLLEAGGERAEAELVAASVLELLRDGMAPEDIAVLVRGASATDLFAQVLDDYGVPVARDRRAPLIRTRLGGGVLAFARAALPGGSAERRRALAAHARQARRARHGRRARGRGAAQGAPDRARGAARVGAPRRRAADRARRSRRGRRGGRRAVPRRACWSRPRRSGPLPTSARPACWAPRPRPTRGRPGRCAGP